MQKGDRLNDEEWLLRRGYFPDKKHIRKDGSIAATAFQPREKDNLELSVDLERLIDYQTAIINPDKFRLCRIQALDAHKIGLACIYDPIEPTESEPQGNPAHSLICGFEKDDIVLPGILARCATVVPYP